MIELQNLSKHYHSGPAVDGLSMTIEAGEFCVLIGPSGCGKSTTLKMINRLIEPTSGEILIDGKPVTQMKPELLRRQIGYVIQSTGLFPHWTVAQNIGVVPTLLKWDAKTIQERVLTLLELLDLDPAEFSNKYPDQLSGGQAQRVGVARALAADPNILLMDEPFGALDPITRETLQLELARIHKELKKTIVFVTHDLDEAIRLADKIALMSKGKIAQYDTPEQMLERPANHFVHDFIGSDRGVRRLSRLPVRDYLESAASIHLDDSLAKAAVVLENNDFAWVLNQKEHLIGWLEYLPDHSKAGAQEDVLASIEDLLTPIDSSFPLKQDSLMKEAVSRMLWQKVTCVPVVDEDSHLLGEVRLNSLLNRK